MNKPVKQAAHRYRGAGPALGPLHGLPVAVKDNRATQDMRPTHASPIYKDNVPDADDPNVVPLRDAGAAVFAKTNLPEFGAGANTVNRVFGATGSRPRWFSGIA